MTDHDRKADDSNTSGPLELNKETLRDLDLEPGDERDVRGGGGLLTRSTQAGAAIQNPASTGSRSAP